MNGKHFIYQLLPRLWGNGRFASCDAEFALYLQSLGVDYLWLTGIPRHASGESFVKGDPGSPYAVCDWYDVNPYLADEPEKRMEEFRSLLDRMHAAGLKCLTDFIPNHVARNYRGALPLYSFCDGDWTDTLKVNWSEPATEKEMLEILRFWAAKGVDGFRCDMVELVPCEALGRVVKAVKREFPGLLFVAEVYGKENYSRYIEEGGFDLLYDKSGAYDILRGINAGRRSARELSRNWQWLGKMQSNMLNFLENHDEQRIASPWFAGSPDAMWPALAFELLFNDASFMLYAGQEAGEDAAEGHEGRTSIFNWCRPRGLEELYSLIHGGDGMSTSSKLVLTRYKELLALAREPVFRYGSNWDLCYCNLGSPGFDPDRHFAFARYDADAAWMVFCNFSSERASALIRYPEELIAAAGLSKAETLVEVPAKGYALVRCR